MIPKLDWVGKFTLPGYGFLDAPSMKLNHCMYDHENFTRSQALWGRKIPARSIDKFFQKRFYK